MGPGCSWAIVALNVSPPPSLDSDRTISTGCEQYSTMQVQLSPGIYVLESQINGQSLLLRTAE